MVSVAWVLGSWERRSLADEYWLHGDSMMEIRLVITRGAEAECPPHLNDLTTTEIDLLTAFVMALGDGPRRLELK